MTFCSGSVIKDVFDQITSQNGIIKLRDSRLSLSGTNISRFTNVSLIDALNSDISVAHSTITNSSHPSLKGLVLNLDSSRVKILNSSFSSLHASSGSVLYTAQT